MALSVATLLWLISLPFIFIFFRRLRYKAMTPEERILAWLGIILLGISVAFQIVQWLGITPTSLSPYRLFIAYVVLYIVLVLAGAYLILSRRKRKELASIDGEVMIERLKRMHDEAARDRVRDFFQETNQTMPTPSPKVASAPAEDEICKETVLTFWVDSTTDWFEIGIENGRLIVINKWKIRDGAYEIMAPFKNYLHINHSKSKSLWIGIKVTFDLPRKKAICVLRKGNPGHIHVKAYYTGFLLKPVGDYGYSSSPNDKNEVTFPLEKM